MASENINAGVGVPGVEQDLVEASPVLNSHLPAQPQAHFIKLTDIIVPCARMRKLRPEKVIELAESMASPRGLVHAIMVTPESDAFRLVVGHHRLEAARSLGWPDIRVEVREGLDADEAELIEIDENLIRADLTDAEIAAHHVRRKQIYLRLHPETKRGGDRRSEEVRSKAQNEPLIPYTKKAAKEIGKSNATVKRAVARGEKIHHVADLVGTSLDKGDELDAMAKLSEEEQRKLAERAIAGEKVSARVRVKQVAREERELRLGVKQCAFPDKKYGVILADPEWDDRVWNRETGMNRHAANHFPVSDPETIKSRPVVSIVADNAVLFLWSTNQHLRIAMDVMEAWGFRYASHYVWKKPSPGLGHWNRSYHEILLIGTRGEIPCPAPGEQWQSVIEAPRPGKHSAKPEIFLEMIEKYFPTLPKIELNRRGPVRPGWDAWGNEVDDEAEPLAFAAE
jgi:N6-adenosine-specific RNA methylase IME4/ParB-like chromosome segregation protein Spo0J